MHMNVRSITFAGAVLVMSTLAGFGQDWTKEPQAWTNNPQVQTQRPEVQPPVPQNTQPQVPQTATQVPQNIQPQVPQNPTQPPPSDYQTESLQDQSEGPEDWTQNLYTHLDFGGSYQQSTTLNQSLVNTTTNVTSSGSAKFNLGVRADVVVGYNINPSWAAEFDTGVIWNSLDSIAGVSLNQPYPLNQSFDTYTVPLLVNIVYKVPLKGDLIPYVAAGAGGAASILSYHRAHSGFMDSAFVFTYQAEVGLKYQLFPDASLGIAYEFLGTTDPSWHSVLTAGAALPTTYHFKESGFYSHSLTISLTWSF
jgi:opacity protein-like surface antigen